MILINGRQFEILENLYTFLYQLGVLGIRNLFVDATNIDQQNLQEKNHQVGHMAEIYRNAAKVLVWLGPSADHSDELFAFMNNPTTSSAFDGLRLNGPDLHSSEHCDRLFGISATREKFAKFAVAFERFLDRNYWARAWIKQEILLGCQVELMVGAETIYWLVFATFIAQYVKTASSSPSDLKLCEAIKASGAYHLCNWQGSSTSAKHDLASIVLRFIRSECAKLHDKVYAYLGMAEDVGSISVDYKTPLSDLLSSVLLSSGSLFTIDQIFHICRHLEFGVAQLALSLNMALRTPKALVLAADRIDTTDDLETPLSADLLSSPLSADSGSEIQNYSDEIRGCVPVSPRAMLILGIELLTREDYGSQSSLMYQADSQTFFSCSCDGCRQADSYYGLLLLLQRTKPDSDFHLYLADSGTVKLRRSQQRYTTHQIYHVFSDHEHEQYTAMAIKIDDEAVKSFPGWRIVLFHVPYDTNFQSLYPLTRRRGHDTEVWTLEELISATSHIDELSSKSDFLKTIVAMKGRPVNINSGRPKLVLSFS